MCVAPQPTDGPTLVPLNLECVTEFLPETEQVRVDCTSSRDLGDLDFECIFNDQSVTEGCEYSKVHALFLPTALINCVVPDGMCVLYAMLVFVIAGGQFPIVVSVAGRPGNQTVVISATDPADGSRFIATTTITTTITSTSEVLPSPCRHTRACMHSVSPLRVN